MKILVTGAAGFIGAALIGHLLKDKDPQQMQIIGIDNINDYYDPSLKFGRLSLLGITPEADGFKEPFTRENFPWQQPVVSNLHPEFSFIRMDIADTEAISELMQTERFDIVVNLAAQAGVRYSIENPRAYIKSNIDGFLNILEGCRQTSVKHLVYASSSSVYGLNGKVPFSESDGIAHPVSLYAASKKSNELMAHAYSSLYSLPVTGLRFFTVYGPWGRPDMSPYLFIDAIANGRPIKVFNNGDMLRDFTYIDDIVEGVARIMKVIPEPSERWDAEKADPSFSSAPYRVYNIGNSEPVCLMDYIQCIENAFGVEAEKIFMPMQPGDVYQTYADSSALARATGFSPATPLQQGINCTVEWYKISKKS